MKVGSIVEYIGASNLAYKAHGRWIDVANLKTNYPYTIRGFSEWQGDTLVYLEEVNAGTHPVLHVELGYNIKLFHELLPPMEIQSALDECKPVLIEL